MFTTCLSPLQTLTWDKFEETTFYLFFKDILKGVRSGIKQCKYWVGNYFSISPWPALSLPESWGKVTDSNLISWGPQEIQAKTQNPLIPGRKKKKRYVSIHKKEQVLLTWGCIVWNLVALSSCIFSPKDSSMTKQTKLRKEKEPERLQSFLTSPEKPTILNLQTFPW